jgi:hypothetical protein
VSGTADGDEVYLTVWLRAASEDVSVSIGMLDRSGVAASGGLVANITTTWVKVQLRMDAGTGGSDPIFVMNPGASAEIWMSYGMAGIVDDDFEDAAIALCPINTTGIFEVEGENA